MDGRAGLSLRDGFDLCGVDAHEMWLRYVALGGTISQVDLVPFLTTDAEPNGREHDTIAQALNEAFLDQDIGTFPVATLFPTTRRSATIVAICLRARSEVAIERSRHLHAQSGRLHARAAELLDECGQGDRARRARERADSALRRAAAV
jgi:hypothetical protein